MNQIYQVAIALLLTTALDTQGWTEISKKGVDDLQTRFLKSCDLAVAEFNKEITRFSDRDNADPASCSRAPSWIRL